MLVVMQNKNNHHSVTRGVHPGRTTSFLTGHHLLIHYSAVGHRPPLL